MQCGINSERELRRSQSKCKGGRRRGLRGEGVESAPSFSLSFPSTFSLSHLLWEEYDGREEMEEIEEERRGLSVKLRQREGEWTNDGYPMCELTRDYCDRSIDQKKRIGMTKRDDSCTFLSYFLSSVTSGRPFHILHIVTKRMERDRPPGAPSGQ